MHGAACHRRLERLHLRRRLVREEPVVPPHERVADGHQLSEHLTRCVRDPDVVAEALRHLLDAVQPLEQRRGHHDLRRQIEGRHDVAADVQVEQLIGTAELDVGAERDRIECLHERIEELVYGNRLPASKRCRNSRRSSICATL